MQDNLPLEIIMLLRHDKPPVSPIGTLTRRLAQDDRLTTVYTNLFVKKRSKGTKKRHYTTLLVEEMDTGDVAIHVLFFVWLRGMFSKEETTHYARRSTDVSLICRSRLLPYGNQSDVDEIVPEVCEPMILLLMLTFFLHLAVARKHFSERRT